MTTMPGSDDAAPAKPPGKPAQRRTGRQAWSTGNARRSAGSVWRYEGHRNVTWRIRYRDATGRRILETLGPEPDWTRRRAEQELRHRLVDVTRDNYTKPRPITFTEYAARWQQDALPARNLKRSTLVDYESVIRVHLLPHFGRTDLEALSHHPDLIDAYTATKLRSGLSPKTVQNHLLILGAMFKQAVRWRLIRHNPVADAAKPRYRPPDLNILTQDEIGQLWHTYHHLIASAASETDAEWWRLAHTLTFTALATAMRRGELLGLRWQDVHLLDNLLHVRQTIVAGRVTTPKSRAGTRTIHLGPRTLDLLAKHYEQSRYHTDPNLVFSHPHLGTPLDPNHLATAYLRPALHAAGITKPFRPYHDLRHTSLTHEAAAGNPHTYIQHKAGHSTSTTTERYIHAAQTAFPGAPHPYEVRLFPP